VEPERWRRIETLFHGALSCEHRQRSSYLDEACSGDGDVRRRIESLLACHEVAEDFLETPALERLARDIAEDQTHGSSPGEPDPNLSGRTVSRYAVLEKLGKGGMGVVYKARDTQLGRLVALKFLRTELSSDRQPMERLQREARAASALDHPNICTVYEIGEFEGDPFISMQYLDGPTLKRLCERKPLPLDTMLDLAIQIADALDAAHSGGIVHRDIKPANILVTGRGQAKLLDFGIAKLTGAPVRTAGPEEQLAGGWGSDLTLTRGGAALGTLAYMSPEQARGEDLDARTDLFSFGAVLYEMATGAPPFQGETPVDVVRGILDRDPALLSRVQPEVPRRLEEIVQKALEKDKERRYQGAAEICLDLKNLKRETELHPAAAMSVSARLRAVSRRRLAGAVVTLAAAFSLSGDPAPSARLASAAIVGGKPSFGSNSRIAGRRERIVFQSDRDDGRYQIYSMDPDGANVVRLTRDAWNNASPALSPDGQKIVFTSDRDRSSHLYVMSADGGETARLTFGLREENAAWSPDGREIAYQGVPDLRTVVYVMNSDGTGSHTITARPFDSQPSWSPDGRHIVFSRTAQIAVMNPDGSGVRILTDLDGYNEWPHYSPDGTVIAFHNIQGDNMQGGAYHTYVIRPDGSGLKQLAPGVPALWPVWSPNGEFLAFELRKGGSQIYRMRPDGGDLRQLTFGSGRSTLPSWGLAR
jgi:Tol biopolymer transport system component/tRNA A-37 threonylcarbamoyl transferase component Bud32